MTVMADAGNETTSELLIARRADAPFDREILGFLPRQWWTIGSRISGLRREFTSGRTAINRLEIKIFAQLIGLVAVSLVAIHTAVATRSTIVSISSAALAAALLVATGGIISRRS